MSLSSKKGGSTLLIIKVWANIWTRISWTLWKIRTIWHNDIMTLWTLLTKTFFDIVDYRVLAKSFLNIYEHFEDISEVVILNHANCHIVFIFVLFHILCIFPEFDCPNSFHFTWTKFSSLLQCLGNIHCSWHVCIQMNIWCPFWWSHWLHLFGIGFQQHSL